MNSNAMEPPWFSVLERIAECKKKAACPRLNVREMYFEPNSETLGYWRDKHRLYLQDIDRRVLFVCESPSERRSRTDPAQFVVCGRKGYICWSTTAQDRRFLKARRHFGFSDCPITNTVKCGLERPSTPANLSSEEAENCSIHLQAEIELMQPKVVACMGNSAYRIFRRHVLPRLTYFPYPLQLTHYSHRGSTKALWQRWEAEFGLIQRVLDGLNGNSDGSF